MTIFKAVRLGIWSLLFAVAITTVGSYLAISQSVLTTEGLNKIVTKSQVADTIRTGTILPKVLEATQSSEYATLLTDKTVTAAVNETFTTAELTRKLEPAVTSFHDWLDSKEPSISFSISTADLTEEFAATLSKKAVESYKVVPTCSVQNTRTQALAGQCRSPFITESSLADAVQQAIKSNSSIEETAAITPNSIVIPATIKSIGGDLPTYLNIFYALSIIAAGVALLIGLWLLLKHRLNGFIALGASGLLASGFLFTVATIGSRSAETLSNDAQAQRVAHVAAELVTASIHTQIFVLVMAGIALIIIGAAAKLFIARYHRSHGSLHLSSDHHDTK